ncbi:MAG: phosphoribosyl-AMP cyclohydrolase [Hyphomicrobiales bacterium]|nr:phosphoribosyl-AMP cyclohydrolase [Hyphomicrobiales bacterium]
MSELETGAAFTPRFDSAGLVSAVVADAVTGEILMLAHMNADAIARTLATGEAHFYSRSRQSLWRKGETSGNVLKVREIRVDCDQDALLLIAELDGAAACHTGARSCFYRTLRAADGAISLTPVASPQAR